MQELENVSKRKEGNQMADQTCWVKTSFEMTAEYEQRGDSGQPHVECECRKHLFFLVWQASTDHNSEGRDMCKKAL